MKAGELRHEDATSNTRLTGYWKKHIGRISEDDKNKPNSVIMRNVAYGYLHNWPKSRVMLMNYMLGHRDQAIHGERLLRRFYSDNSTLKTQERGAISGSSHVTINDWSDDWEEVFGPEPKHLLEEVPEGYVPEEFDCKWYLSVELETKGFSYYALMVKKGKIFGRWDKSNTVVKSHLFGKSKTLKAPYPVEISFLLEDHPTDQAIKFTDQLIHPLWVDIEPRPYRGSTGPSPHVVYEFEYPLYDKAQDTFLPAKATLSSAPGRNYKKVERLIDNLESFNLDSIGKHFRNEAGVYQMPILMK